MKKNRIKSKIEYLSRTEIEERASLMLQYVLPDRSEDPNPPALKEIVTVLQSKYNVQFSFSKNLGNLPSGEKFLGMFTVNPLTIHICSSIKAWSPDFYRTLAHELGHLVLHRKMIGDGKYISKDKPIIDTASSYATEKQQS